MIINKIKRNILEHLLLKQLCDDIEEKDLKDEENIDDIWEECKSYILENKILEQIINIIDNENDEIEEVDIEIDKINIKKFVLFKEDIDNNFSINNGIINKQNFFMIDVKNFLKLSNDDIQKEDIKTLITLLMKKDIIEFLFNLDLEKIDDMFILFLLDKSENFKCNFDKEALLKSVLAFFNIPYIKHIEFCNQYFVDDNEEFICKKNYEQYEEILNIFHEYLNSTDPLWKFLLLYHIIENFSFRKPIVEHLRRKDKETDYIFVNELSLIYPEGRDEKKVIEEAIKDLINNEKRLKENLNLNLNHELYKYAKHIYHKLGNQNLNFKQFGELVYKIRNAIVHNKETEWLHINHNMLNTNNILKLFTEYLLPNLEKIIRCYIFNENKQLDYLDEGPNYILLWGKEIKKGNKN